MANFEIDEDQAALIRELRKLETSDPVHANVYNALFEKLINNDAFLERLANKMVEKSMLCHVLDSVNAQQVLAADVGPKITAITNELKENVSVLNTKNDNYGKILWTGSSFFATPENVPDCSNYKVLIFYNSIGAYSVWRDSILTFTYLANSSLYIDTFSVLRNGNTIKLTNNTRYCAGTISTSDIPITKIMGVV
uniref:hypothetical protein n=1 Tax=Enterocloster clostridioformis TaxID=1531 RepID=UPI002A83E5FD|nr:hypothetical protein [Enterocloster clostridioformis]